MTWQSWLTFVLWSGAPRIRHDALFCLTGAAISLPRYLLKGALLGRLPSSSAPAALALVVCVCVCAGGAICAVLLGTTSGKGADVVSGASVGALMPSDMPSPAAGKSSLSRTMFSAVGDPSCNQCHWPLQHVGLTHSMD